MIDAHVHFWNPTRLHYPWLRTAEPLQRMFEPNDLGALANDEVDAVLFVEANCEPSEADAELDYVDELTAREPRIAGSVAFVDMTGGDVTGVLDRVAQRERIVGVRHNIQGRPAGFCLTSSFVAGVQSLEGRDLAFDLCITADQFVDAIELARRCPRVPFVLDHCGKPLIRGDAFDAWAFDVANLSSLENVACKISGLFTEARPDQRNATALRPYVEHARGCFGAERLLYGSDWPVVNLAGGEALWRATIHELTSDWSAAERQLFYSENAMRHYAIQHHAGH